MNMIFEEVLEERNGHYCHCVEVNEVYELESIADSICEVYGEKYGEEEVIDFLESLEVYSLDDANESEIFAFSFTEYVKGTI